MTRERVSYPSEKKGVLPETGARPSLFWPTEKATETAELKVILVALKARPKSEVLAPPSHPHHLRRRPRLISSEAFLAWHEEMMLRVRRYRPKTPIARAAVAITFFAENCRIFDLTNAAESVMDLLVDAKILADDSWAVVPELTVKLVGPNQWGQSSFFDLSFEG